MSNFGRQLSNPGDPGALKASIRRLLALEPQRMYLTHYGAVEQPGPLGKRLLAQVDDYVRMAEAVAASTPAERWEEQLMARMEDYLLTGARGHGCDLPAQELQEVLGMDVRLNSQGLAVWLQARAAG